MQTNKDYHADRTHISSSGLKLLLDDPGAFYEKYVANQTPEEERKAHFLEGEFTHALIYEPETIPVRFAVYSGLVKRGKQFDAFKAEHPQKEILSAAQVLRCERWVKAYKALPIAVKMLEGTISEHTMTGEIMGVKVKARTDAINIAEGYISDVKTTSMPSGTDFFKVTVEEYAYQLSAALYCEIARQTYNKNFDFYWTVLSKNDNGCEIYQAKPSTLARGTALYTQALLLYKHCLSTGIWAVQQSKQLESREYEIISI